jgi:flavin-dependent dehydrogenase
MSKRVFPNYFLGRSSSVLIPANISILDKITGKNWLVIGDAAITHDPISSYGLNFGLKTSFQAVSVIK